MNHQVTDYPDQILRPQLAAYGTNAAFTEELCSTVERQMSSALKHWKDVPFRNALMLLVSEEAPFYQPDAPLEVKSFVVLTLRNSPFESLQSKDFQKTGLRKKLTDSQVIKVTSAAVRYFKDADLSAIDPPDCAEDIYFSLSQRYPVAWNALYALANCPENTCSFPPARHKGDIDSLIGLHHAASDGSGSGYSVKDGYDADIESTLAEQLQAVLNARTIPFFSDSFKMISRNPELLMKVLEFLLANDLTYVSTNYLIENGHAEKRKNILKALHLTSKDVAPLIRHCTNTNGISPRHRKFLLDIREMLLQEGL